MAIKKNFVLVDGNPISIDKDVKNLSVKCLKPGCFTIKGNYNGNSFSSSMLRDGNKYHVNINGTSYVVEAVPEDHFNEQEIINSDESKVFAPMTGIIRDILVKDGDEIHSGQLLLRIESMKLVLTVNSSNKGIINQIKVKTGQKVSAGDLILEININE
jgi:biotin carboxyl carrier protein